MPGIIFVIVVAAAMGGQVAMTAKGAPEKGPLAVTGKFLNDGAVKAKKALK